jgi:uncharacterized CHY-type Zn-finger protein
VPLNRAGAVRIGIAAVIFAWRSPVDPANYHSKPIIKRPSRTGECCNILVLDLMIPNSPDVRGVDLDPQTRCEHYHGPTDIVAIKMKCCGLYYACKDCHEALAGHPLEVWPANEWDRRAILCGACGSELTIQQYTQCDSRCPTCRAQFNPGCRNHYHFYFGFGDDAKSS